MVNTAEAKTFIIQPYSGVVYNSTIPLLRDGVNNFNEGGRGQQAVNTVIRDCFLNHGVETEFSACILHKHYDLAENERNVEYHGKAIGTTNLDGIYPCSWIFHNGECYPYEYTRHKVPEPNIKFVEALGRILEEAGMCSIIGFQCYTNGQVAMEKTVNHESITTMHDEKDSSGLEQYNIPASFAFFGT